MRIGITYDLKSDAPLLSSLSRGVEGGGRSGLPDDFQEEFDSPTTIEAISQVLCKLGHEVDKLGDGRELLARLLGDPPELVFNIAEGQGIARSREARVPALLEMLGIPYTGSDPLTLAVTLDKDCAKRLVRSAGVAVPKSVLVESGEHPRKALLTGDVPFPAIVKPAWEGSSKGIRNKCLVERPEDLPEVVEALRRDHRQPVLVEEFVTGDELTVGVIGNHPARVLGVMRVLPVEATDRFIYSLEIKRDYLRQVRYECPARLGTQATEAVREAALAAWRVLGCRDVSRVDFRLRDGVPYFLEVNPLPGLNPESSDLVIMARLLGLSHAQLIEAILDSALKRLANDPDRGCVVRMGRSGEPSRTGAARLAVATSTTLAHESTGAWVTGATETSNASPRVVVLYNDPVLPPGHPQAASEWEILTTVESIRGTLRQAGFLVTLLGVGADPQALLTGLRRERPDVVFNLFEGLATNGQTEAAVAGLLEWLEVPFTGSPAQALSLAYDKYRTKQLLQGAGLPTPAFFVVDRPPCPPCPLAWPVIVKPAHLDASVGIEQASVVTSHDQLNRRVAHVLQRYGPPALVEQFIRGREFHITVVEEAGEDPGVRRAKVLPLAEIEFRDEGAGSWPIYSYDAKWRINGREYQATPLHAPVSVAPDLMDRITRIAEQAYHLVGCRDYARIDVRMTAAGELHILEVNPNPFINSKSLTNGLLAVGRSQVQFLVDMVRAALARGEQRSPQAPRAEAPSRGV
jgi:D-alanine-D-alanine ligase